MALSYDEVLKRVAESRRETVASGVRLLEPLIEGRISFEAEWRAYEESEPDQIVAAISACAVDEDGRLLFDTPERKAVLRNEAGGAFVQSLFAAAMECLTITRAEVERAVGECEGDQTGERSSPSPSDSASPIPTDS